MINKNFKMIGRKIMASNTKSIKRDVGFSFRLNSEEEEKYLSSLKEKVQEFNYKDASHFFRSMLEILHANPWIFSMLENLRLEVKDGV